jgi:hypothetical protein
MPNEKKEYGLYRAVVVVCICAIAWATFNPCHPVKAAEPRPPESSRIVELFDNQTGMTAKGGGKKSHLDQVRLGKVGIEDPGSQAAGENRPFDLSSYRRPDMIGNIFKGNFELVPATGLDNLRYYAQAVGDLAARCPTLQLESAKHQVFPYLLSGVTDLVERFQTGQLSQSEILQAVWMAILGLNQHWDCQYVPGQGSFEQAQARCNQAGQDRTELGVLPSFDAAHDITLFLGRYGCESNEARSLARQLIDFGRTAHASGHFAGPMPPPDSPAGQAYAAIFENCTLSSIDDSRSQWCGCYVRTLHSLKPPRKVLYALAQNPFVDGATYISWVVRNLAGGETLYKCESKLIGKPDWGEYHAPRSTACLVDDIPAPQGERECRYRTAWGEFIITGEQCAPEILSSRWGYQEVDCKRGGIIATAPTGPRVWKNGVFTMIDYESELTPDFVPSLPVDARQKHPLEARFLKRDTPGLLLSMSLTSMTDANLVLLGAPFKLLTQNFDDIAAVGREGALLLSCKYKANKGVRVKSYWFEKVPEHMRARKVSPALQPYFARIGGPVTICPARD